MLQRIGNAMRIVIKNKESYGDVYRECYRE